MEEWLARLGLQNLEVESKYVYMLIVPESGRTIFRGRDYLRALSNDGRYLVSESQTGLRLRAAVIKRRNYIRDYAIPKWKDTLDGFFKAPEHPVATPLGTGE